MFYAIKKVYKLLGINHWKSIKFYSNLDLSTINTEEGMYIPSNYPLFNPELEVSTTVLYTFNKLVEVYGVKAKKGGRYFNDPNIFYYDDIFYKHFEDPILIQISQIKNENINITDLDKSIFEGKNIEQI